MTRSPYPRRSNSFLLFALTSLVALTATVTTGCGGSGGSAGIKPSGNTEVTVLLTSTANDQLSEFNLQFSSITLTNKAGSSVSVLTSQQQGELIHVNGGAGPLVTVSVPQDTYTAATVAIGDSLFTCLTTYPSGDSTGLVVHEFGSSPTPSVTVNVPTPITISGDSMVLALDLLASQSETFSSCYNPDDSYTFSITPAFNLTPLVLSAEPTNPENGKITNLNGEIISVDVSADSFVLSPPWGPATLSVSSTSVTAYQGISSFSALAVGMFVDMDGAVQPDGSLQATRIAVEDSNTNNLSVLIGPVVQTNAYGPQVTALGREQQGYLSTIGQAAITMPYNFTNSVFQISGALANLQSLPFTASFNATNMVPGQNVYVTTDATQFIGYPFMPAETITLMPQTVDAVIQGTSNSGGFAIYTVTLASYDLFPTLGAQSGLTAMASNPGQIVAYVDSNTQMLNSEPLAIGNTFRFNGLVFDDNGTLRMDCAQINDGVPQ